MGDFLITSPSGKEMLGELPDYYEPILEMRVIMQREGLQFDKLQQDIEDQLNQRFAATATWDLPNWEEELGIVPPAGQPIDQRRSVIRSKMRGFGKFSGKLVKNVAEAYINGEVNVAFFPNMSTFEITFIGERGIPPNLSDIQRQLADIIPAHLLYEFKYTYLYWDDLETHNLTWNQAETYTWGELETAFL